MYALAMVKTFKKKVSKENDRMKIKNERDYNQLEASLNQLLILIFNCFKIAMQIEKCSLGENINNENELKATHYNKYYVLCEALG